MKTIAFDFSVFSSDSYILLDVRSEGEFAQGHIPRAINLPLLRNEERVLVGTKYKQEGNLQAVLLGYQLVGPRFYELIQQAIDLSAGKPILLHCWRGGLRSRIMAQLLSNAGLEITVLQGGYKSYRHWVHSSFNEPYSFKVLGGFTGSGKTEMLHRLAELGNQVLDLEHLASHRGSAFGAIGLNPQPTQEQFENNLAAKLAQFKDELPIWVEDEARMIGKLQLPDSLFHQMRESTLVVVEIQKEERFKRILNEYGSFPTELLVESTKKIGKKLGDLRLRKAISALQDGDMVTWLEEVLFYYDRTYKRALRDTPENVHHRLEGHFEEVFEKLKNI